VFKGWKSLALAVLVVLPALGRMDPAEAGDGAARVLLVHSYHENLEWTADINRGFLAAVHETGTRIELYVEYLDSIRFPERSGDDFLAYLQAKYSARPPDLLVVADDPAFDILKVHRDRIAPGRTLIFTGLNESWPRKFGQRVKLSPIASKDIERWAK
jgi:hypothetical protein